MLLYKKLLLMTFGTTLVEIPEDHVIQNNGAIPIQACPHLTITSGYFFREKVQR